MDRALLEEYLARGLSLSRIGKLANRDASTVGYWVRKHGLAPVGRSKHAARGGLAKEQLEALVTADATLQQMAAAVGRSVATVRYWLRRFDLKPRTRRPGRRPRIPYEEVQLALKEGRRTVEGVCPNHGATTFVIENSGRTRCRLCRQARVADWRREVKRRLVAEAGGGCRLCGYNRYLGALEFHHLDPSRKKFALSVRGMTRSMAELRAEAAKCVLLCANCHAEVERGLTSLSLD